jgi:hypothetical protein
MHHVVFSSPEPNVSIRVDAMVNIPESDPIASWEDLESRFVKAYGDRYQRLSMYYSSLGGERSATWTFTIRKKGQPLLKKLDIGLYHNGTGFAVLCTAPPESFEAMQQVFLRAISSFRFTGGQP